jgi:hypothetical protein
LARESVSIEATTKASESVPRKEAAIRIEHRLVSAACGRSTESGGCRLTLCFLKTLKSQFFHKPKRALFIYADVWK